MEPREARAAAGAAVLEDLEGLLEVAVVGGVVAFEHPLDVAGRVGADEVADAVREDPHARVGFLGAHVVDRAEGGDDLGEALDGALGAVAVVGAVEVGVREFVHERGPVGSGGGEEPLEHGGAGAGKAGDDDGAADGFVGDLGSEGVEFADAEPVLDAVGDLLLDADPAEGGEAGDVGVAGEEDAHVLDEGVLAVGGGAGAVHGFADGAVEEAVDLLAAAGDGGGEDRVDRLEPGCDAFHPYHSFCPAYENEVSLPPSREAGPPQSVQCGP
jgi:hypothetical protein